MIWIFTFEIQRIVELNKKLRFYISILPYSQRRLARIKELKQSKILHHLYRHYKLFSLESDENGGCIVDIYIAVTESSHSGKLGKITFLDTTCLLTQIFVHCPISRVRNSIGETCFLWEIFPMIRICRADWLLYEMKMLDLTSYCHRDDVIEYGLVPLILRSKKWILWN